MAEMPVFPKFTFVQCPRCRMGTNAQTHACTHCKGMGFSIKLGKDVEKEKPVSACIRCNDCSLALGFKTPARYNLFKLGLLPMRCGRCKCLQNPQNTLGSGIG